MQRPRRDRWCKRAKPQAGGGSPGELPLGRVADSFLCSALCFCCSSDAIGFDYKGCSLPTKNCPLGRNEAEASESELCTQKIRCPSFFLISNPPASVIVFLQIPNPVRSHSLSAEMKIAQGPVPPPPLLPPSADGPGDTLRTRYPWRPLLCPRHLTPFGSTTAISTKPFLETQVSPREWPLGGDLSELPRGCWCLTT